jgi:hypothetical protein
MRMRMTANQRISCIYIIQLNALINAYNCFVPHFLNRSDTEAREKTNCLLGYPTVAWRFNNPPFLI